MCISEQQCDHLGDFCTLGNFLKPLAAFNLPKSPTILGNFCNGVKIYDFSSEIPFRQLYRHLAIFFWSHGSAVTMVAIRKILRGGSPGLVVMGRDSNSKGCGFESRHRLLDGHFFTYFCCKNCNVCLKRPKINEKEAGVGPFKKILLPKTVSILKCAIPCPFSITTR